MPHGQRYSLKVSFAEIKQQLVTLTVEQRLELAALLTHLSQSDDPQYQVDLDRKLAEMDSGTRFYREDLEHFTGSNR